MVREILIWPDPVLARKCEEVKEFNVTLHQLLDDMVETMAWARGAGLAAPQVGFALRAVVVLVQKEDGTREPLKLVNPRIMERRGSVLLREGCLSLPGYFESVRRAQWVRVEAQDEQGAKIEISGDGVLAHALQHEIDHLDGICFPQHLSPLKRQVVATRFSKRKAKGMRYAVPRLEPRDFTQA